MMTHDEVYELMTNGKVRNGVKAGLATVLRRLHEARVSEEEPYIKIIVSEVKRHMAFRAMLKRNMAGMVSFYKPPELRNQTDD